MLSFDSDWRSLMGFFAEELGHDWDKQGENVSHFVYGGLAK